MRIVLPNEDCVFVLQIRFQPNDHKTIKETADELKIFEGLKHPNLVRYFGVELHRVRTLSSSLHNVIPACQGTLQWELVEGSLDAQKTQNLATKKNRIWKRLNLPQFPILKQKIIHLCSQGNP